MSGTNDPNLLVLISLAGGPRHGHAIMLDVRDFAGVRLGPGTLYGAISRLEAEGLIAAMPPEGRRQPYRLTRLGRAALGARLVGLNGAVQAGLQRLESAP
jgi:DNA-binding PadR family transcriptional regulator